MRTKWLCQTMPRATEPAQLIYIGVGAIETDAEALTRHMAAHPRDRDAALACFYSLACGDDAVAA